MKSPLVILLAAICLTAVSVKLTAKDGPAKKQSATRAPVAEIWSYTQKSLFPSAIISTAVVDWHDEEAADSEEKIANDAAAPMPVYGDENGWLAALIHNVPKGAKIDVELSMDGYLKPSKWEGVVDEAAEAIQVFPKAQWNFDALNVVRQEKPVTLNLKVSVNGKALPEDSETCILKSINDCPFYVIWDDEEEDFEDFSVIFTAYVNENHPLVDEILKEALETEIVNSFDGYQSGDPEVVYDQVFAVWHALQRRGIRYSDISNTTPGKSVVSQTVRFIDESVAAKQANCVDGVVLMASVLRKLGLKTHQVMTPGHCFLAFEDGSDEKAELVGLETTMLGSDKLKPVKELPKLSEKAKKKEFAASLKTFLAAVSEGNARLVEHKEAFEKADAPDVQIISVDDARELGVIPIASGNAGQK